VTVPDAAERFRYLSEESPESRAAFEAWLEKEVAARGFLNELGRPYAAKSVASMLR
jgi:hypothetical protein